MKLENIDFKSGTLTYNEFYIDSTISIEKQIAYLGEDMLQAEYPDNYVLDVGWYHGPNGRFVIYVIKDYEWDKPALRKETRSLFRLEQYIQQAVDFITQSIDNKKAIISDEINCNFNHSEFVSFFDEEHVLDRESGSYSYSMTLSNDLELRLYILAIDKFAAIEIACNSLNFNIIDIGFEQIDHLKLNYNKDLQATWLELYRNYSINEEECTPYLSIPIKPNITIELTIP